MDVEIKKLRSKKVAELRKILMDKNLPTTGTKQILLDRIKASILDEMSIATEHNVNETNQDGSGLNLEPLPEVLVKLKMILPLLLERLETAEKERDMLAAELVAVKGRLDVLEAEKKSRNQPL